MKASPPADGSPDSAALVDRYSSATMPRGDKRGKKKIATRENRQMATPANPPETVEFQWVLGLRQFTTVSLSESLMTTLRLSSTQ